MVPTGHVCRNRQKKENLIIFLASSCVLLPTHYKSDMGLRRPAFASFVVLPSWDILRRSVGRSVDFSPPHFTLYHRRRINYFLCAHPHPITESVGSCRDGCSANYHPPSSSSNDYVVTVMSQVEGEAQDYDDGAGRRQLRDDGPCVSNTDFMNCHDTSASIPWHIIKR